MKVIFSFVFFLSLLAASFCYAVEIDDVVKTCEPKYNFLGIVQEIRQLPLDTDYIGDDLLIGRSVCAKVNEGDQPILKLLEAEINKLNSRVEKNTSEFVQNWSIRLYGKDTLLLRKAPIKSTRLLGEQNTGESQ
ncbi:MAG: hypothetical protein K2W94_06340 [Alphaproteobacteria bacterium]|nr:hypothetical protein [Alphaproteobacteria bacterium]